MAASIEYGVAAAIIVAALTIVAAFMPGVRPFSIARILVTFPPLAFVAQFIGVNVRFRGSEWHLQQDTLVKTSPFGGREYLRMDLCRVQSYVASIDVRPFGRTWRVKMWLRPDGVSGRYAFTAARYVGMRAKFYVQTIRPLDEASKEAVIAAIRTASGLS